MSDTQIRISIAEACGWHVENSGNKHSDLIFNPQGNSVKRWIDLGHVTPNLVDTWITCEHLPDYLTDLNAAHEMELWLARNRPELENEYDRNLARETHGLNTTTVAGQPGFYVTLLRRAPARSRAMAFLRTIGK